jgi:adenylate cyclase
MGASRRINYTALGDAVNVASRLEGVNKIYKTRIVISHSTYQHVKDRFECRVLDRVAVLGKSESITIYELLTEKTAPDAERFAELAREFEEIHKLYLGREWEAALARLKKLRERFPDDPVCALYIERCERARKDAPGPSWDGVLRPDSK